MKEKNGLKINNNFHGNGTVVANGGQPKSKALIIQDFD
jgi:phosphoenolpyruvate carboxylase